VDAFPRAGDLDEDTLLLDADEVVEGDELLGLGLGALLVERESGVDLGGDTAGDDLEDLGTEVDELWVRSCVQSGRWKIKMDKEI
jgi:voltage-gated potassium channel Kch